MSQHTVIILFLATFLLSLLDINGCQIYPLNHAIIDHHPFQYLVAESDANMPANV